MLDQIHANYWRLVNRNPDVSRRVKQKLGDRFDLLQKFDKPSSTYSTLDQAMERATLEQIHHACGFEGIAYLIAKGLETAARARMPEIDTFLAQEYSNTQQVRNWQQWWIAKETIRHDGFTIDDKDGEQLHRSTSIDSFLRAKDAFNQLAKNTGQLPDHPHHELMSIHPNVDEECLRYVGVSRSTLRGFAKGFGYDAPRADNKVTTFHCDAPCALLLKYKQEPCAIISGRLCNYSLDFKIIQIQGIAPFKLTPDGDYVRDYKEMALTAHEASAYFKTRSPAQVVSFNAPVRARQSKGLFENWQGFLIKELAQRLTYQTKLLMPTPEIHPACVLIGRGVMNDPHLTTAQIEKNYIQPFVALGGQLVGDYYELPLPIK